MSGVRSSTVANQRKSDHPKRNSVTYNPEVTVHLIPYEDRKSEWMQRAIDRCHSFSETHPVVKIIIFSIVTLCFMGFFLLYLYICL